MNFLEQKDLALIGYTVPLSLSILKAEPRLIRISTSIGAKGRDSTCLSSFQKEKFNN